MPNFETFVKTNQGVSLDNKLALQGGSLELTRMVVGSGIWPGGTEPATLTALVSEELSVAVGAPEPLGDGRYKVRAVLSNVGLVTGFSWQESGVYAVDPDLGEILYMVTHVADPATADYIPAENGPNLVEMDFAFLVQSADGIEVTAVLDDTLVLATKRDVENHARLARLTALTGGGSGALDAIPWGECVDNELAVVEMGGGLLAFYRFDKDSTATESAPSCIKPDNAGANPGRWLQRGTVGESELWDALDAEIAARAAGDASLNDALAGKQPLIPDGGLSLAKLDIDGATDIGANLADADLIVVDDGAAGKNRKSALSRVWTYINGKISGAVSGVLTSNLTASRALVSNASGKVAVSAVTSTELGYLDGVTSSVQTQLNAKAAASHSHPAGSFVTTSSVLSALAGTSVGSVGSHALLRPTSAFVQNPGTTRSGSGLTYSDVDNNGGGAKPAGTWRLMGGDTGDRIQAGLWLRIA